MQKKPFILAIVGPTSSGKSELAVWAAKKYKGQIVSVDSRQVYKGMDIGTGKVPLKKMSLGKSQVLTYKNIPHWGLNLASPKRLFSVANFQKYASKSIKAILKNNELPVLCGGTGFWMDALVYNQKFPNVKPNKKLRKELSKKSKDELLQILLEKDPIRASQIDIHNPRRILRAIEIAESSMEIPKPLNTDSLFDCLWIGLAPSPDELRKKITDRLDKRIRLGMVKEVEKLLATGVSSKKLISFGLEYKFATLYLEKKLSKEAFREELLKSIFQYTKRQMTWWKRNKEINWFANIVEAQNFLNVELLKK